MSKPIAIAFSDLHLHKFKDFNESSQRLLNSLDVLRRISNLCEDYGVPAIFAGDLYHNAKELDNEVGSAAEGSFKRNFENKGIDFIAISGNHDMAEKNGLSHKSPSHLHGHSITFTHFKLIDWGCYKNPNMVVHGIPYCNSDLDFIKSVKKATKEVKNCDKNLKKILIIHTDLPGAKTCEGLELNENPNIPRNLKKFFKHWDLVLSGHIHKPQKLSKNCYMLGSPLHQNRGDIGVEMGLYVIYDDRPPKFIALPYPQFIKLGKGENPPELSNNYYIPYIESVFESEEESTKGFNIKKSRKSLAKKYLKTKGITDKKKKGLLIKFLNEAE